ncbi:MAG: hypothetical protein HC889_11035 [Synechococcaceae cyanobacterium SM1_2_3]|nr:hypothetical protein [Synechococcaceae cyanobacterium SM1_2_3]
MITLYAIKPAFQNLLRPAAHWLYQNGVSANQVVAALVLAAIMSGALWLCGERFYPPNAGAD